MVKGYKVFNQDWTCRGFQYEVGGIFEEDVTAGAKEKEPVKAEKKEQPLPDFMKVE